MLPISPDPCYLNISPAIFNVLPLTFPVGPIWKEESYYETL